MDLARIIAEATDEHLNSPQMAEHFITIPASICKPMLDADQDQPDQYDETLDWPDDHKLDDPRHVPHNYGRPIRD